MFLYKVFESTNRVVHLIRFHNLEKMKEEDFPESTKLEEGEGMLPREVPLRAGPRTNQAGQQGRNIQGNNFYNFPPTRGNISPNTQGNLGV